MVKARIKGKRHSGAMQTIKVDAKRINQGGTAVKKHRPWTRQI
ncbi:hypothetical protein JMA_21760 [Jeotgalibacillus malaysiensis]|uniref:Uncharacterized protein n=1 Tax=Jeotgalibacillus malaysiensis TaxID=1508404 RepID=A0A0B5ASF8_9BACL|nr:hypothetical protein JMA_21760 [Jeotgalibacillus malaysiensis]